MTDLHPRLLRAFVAVAEELNVTRAAERLLLPQPVVSQQVRQLERALQVAVFVRLHRGVALTAAGTALLPRAQALLAQLSELRTVARESSGSLTVGFHTRLARGLAPRLRESLTQLAPGSEFGFLQVSWADPTIGLADRSVDVALGWRPVPGAPDYTSRTVGREERWVALPAGHRLSGRSAVAFADVRDEPFVALPSSAGAMREFWLAADRRVVPASVAREAATSDEALELVAAGVGVALLSRGNAALFAREDVTCLPITDLSAAELAVVWRTRDDRQLVRSAVDALAVACACDPVPAPPTRSG